MKGKIISINNEKAVISTEDGQSLFVAIKDIFGQVLVGSEVFIAVRIIEDGSTEEQMMARDLLNELLKKVE